MENMDNNLEDFLKKHLNSSNEPIEDWAKPDPSDWDKAAAQIPMFNHTPFWTLSNMSIIGLSTVLIGSLFYIWYLQVEVSTLEQNIKVQDENIERVQKDIKIIDEKYIQQQSILEEENIILKQENQTITQQNQTLKTITNQQQKVISKLYLPNSEVKTRTDKADKKPSLNEKNKDNIEPLLNKEKQSKSSNRKPQQPIAEHIQNDKSNSDKNEDLPLDNKTKDQAENLLSGLNTLSLATLEDNSNYQNMRLPKANPLIDNSEKRRKKLNIDLPKFNMSGVAIGYEYRIQEMPVSSSLNVKELEMSSDEHDFGSNHINLHGLTLNIPVKDKLVIQTGIRYSRSPLSYTNYSDAKYSEENEYTLPDGTIVKNFNVEQETPFSITNTEAQLLFDAGRKLENNEDFKWWTEGFQEQQMVQIPLGAIGKMNFKKFHSIFGGGVQWNNITLGEIDYQMYVFNHENDFRIFTSSTDIIRETESLDYFSVYTTAGIGFQLLKNWSIYATGTFSYHFSNQVTRDLWSNKDSALSLGLQYQF